jgi:hypothetical protein
MLIEGWLADEVAVLSVLSVGWASINPHLDTVWGA